MKTARLKLKGSWLARCHGKGEGAPVLWWEAGDNDITTEGLTDLLGVAFAGGTPHAAWYAGLIAGEPAPSLLAADTLASHAGWAEQSTGFGGSPSRRAWAPAAAGGVAVNASPITFLFSAAVTLGGLFLCSAVTGTTGVLWSTAPFATTRRLAAGQSLRVSYRLRAASGG